MLSSSTFGIAADIVYGPTKGNDAIYSIAKGLLPPDRSISIHQMMMALLKANQHAFENNNVNRLKRKMLLYRPAPEDFLSRKEAWREFNIQMGNWKQNERPLQTVDESAKSGQSTETITTKTPPVVEEITRSDVPDTQLGNEVLTTDEATKTPIELEPQQIEPVVSPAENVDVEAVAQSLETDTQPAITVLPTATSSTPAVTIEQTGLSADDETSAHKTAEMVEATVSNPGENSSDHSVLGVSTTESSQGASIQDNSKLVPKTQAEIDEWFQTEALSEENVAGKQAKTESAQDTGSNSQENTQENVAVIDGANVANAANTFEGIPVDEELSLKPATAEVEDAQIPGAETQSEETAISQPAVETSQLQGGVALSIQNQIFIGLAVLILLLVAVGFGWFFKRKKMEKTVGETIVSLEQSAQEEFDLAYEARNSAYTETDEDTDEDTDYINDDTNLTTATATATATPQPEEDDEHDVLFKLSETKFTPEQASSQQQDLSATNADDESSSDDEDATLHVSATLSSASINEMSDDIDQLDASNQTQVYAPAEDQQDEADQQDEEDKTQIFPPAENTDYEEDQSLNINLNKMSAAQESESASDTLYLMADDQSEELDQNAIATQLELAKAYIDMGDKDGARWMLDEIIAAGSEEQKKEATALMQKLD